MAYNPTDVLLKLVIEDFCLYVHQTYGPVVFFPVVFKSDFGTGVMWAS